MPNLHDRKHIIVIGRVSSATRNAIIAEFGAENVIDAYVDKYKDEEAAFALEEKINTEGLTKEQIKNEILSRELKAANLRDAHVTFISSDSGFNVSARAWSKVFAAEYLKLQKQAYSLTAIGPQTGFLRADKPFVVEVMIGQEKIEPPYAEENAISCRAYANTLKANGYNRYIGLTEHSRDALKHFQNAFGYRWLNLPAILNPAHPTIIKLRSSFNKIAQAFNLDPNARFVSTASLFADRIKQEFPEEIASGLIIIGSPDGANKKEDFGILRAYDLRKSLLGNKFTLSSIFQDPFMFFIEKVRKSDTKTEITNFFIGDEGTVNNKVAIITDDIISSGTTLFDAAQKLKREGAKKVIACITHAVLVNDAIEKILANDDLDELWVTDTVPSCEERIGRLKNKITKDSALDDAERTAALNRLNKIKIISSAPLIVDAIKYEHKILGLSFKADNDNRPAPKHQVA